jgi:hypothetical protein
MKSFLQDVNQRIIAFFSDADIAAGQRWGLELATQLEATDYGIICVTRESLRSSWILFEAGALSKSVSGGRVCPYLVDLKRPELTGPLSQFQAKEASRVHTWEMLQSVNLAMGQESLSEERLERYFEMFWPALESAVLLANRELKPLPEGVEQQLLDTIPPLFYRVQEIELFALQAELPVWAVNLNQAAIYVWRDLIQLAVNERKLDALLGRVVERAPAIQPRIRDAQEKVGHWTQSFEEPDK